VKYKTNNKQVDVQRTLTLYSKYSSFKKHSFLVPCISPTNRPEPAQLNSKRYPIIL